MNADRLIVALDTPHPAQARRLFEALSPLGVTFKMGYEALFNFNREAFEIMATPGARFFLDGKLHDIPRTVEAAVHALVRPGVTMLTVHAQGGNDMMRSAVEAANERAQALGIATPAIFAVTILTSIAPEDLGDIGISGGPGEAVTRLAALARDAGCAGVVCSANEVADLKSFFGSDFQTVCPGIRPAGAAHGDQKRIATPASALAAGADYLVVGRPITEAGDPLSAARAILAEMEHALV